MEQIHMTDRQLKHKITAKIAKQQQIFGGDIDFCNYDERFGIGHNELRYFGIDDTGEPYFESNNVHDMSRGQCDQYYKYHWDELSTYEKVELQSFFESKLNNSTIAIVNPNNE